MKNQQKGARRARKSLKRRQNHGIGPRPTLLEGEVLTKDPSSESMARNRFRMMKRSVAKKWRDFDRVADARPHLPQKLVEAAYERAKVCEEKAVAYGSSRGFCQ